MIEILYSSVGIVIGVAYLPQITKLLLSQHPCHGISVASWSMWAYTSIVSLLYSIYGQEVLDTKFVFVNAVNLACIFMIIGITMFKRYKYKPAPIETVEPPPCDSELSVV